MIVNLLGSGPKTDVWPYRNHHYMCRCGWGQWRRVPGRWRHLLRRSRCVSFRRPHLVHCCIFQEHRDTIHVTVDRQTAHCKELAQDFLATSTGGRQR